MLDLNENRTVFGRGAETAHAREATELTGSVRELLGALTDESIVSLVRDLRSFESSGRVSDRVERMLQRAHCIAAADHIMQKYRPQAA